MVANASASFCTLILMSRRENRVFASQMILVINDSRLTRTFGCKCAATAGTRTHLTKGMSLLEPDSSVLFLHACLSLGPQTLISPAAPASH